MAKFPRLYYCYTAISFLLFFAFQLGAQSFTASVQPYASPALSKQFSNFQVFELDASALDAYVKSNAESPAQLKVGAHNWQLNLTSNPILSENYSLQVQTPQGVTTTHPKPKIAFKGYELNGGGLVRLALNGEFLYGFVEEGVERYYIEPLWYYEPNASHDLFVLYAKSAVLPMAPGACGVTEEQIAHQHLEDGPEKGGVSKAENSGCYVLEMAIASDRKMFDKYGSVAAVQDHNIAVNNDVEGDYNGNFNNDLSFLIVTQFVVSGTDPWTNSTAPGTLLDSFAAWGNGGGFGVAFDNGELWTNRDFDGNVIGIAYLNGICNTAKYHCLQDFSNNAEFLRCLGSHELGHNFSAVHDAPNSGFIMAPAVSNSTTWSDPSLASINAYMQSKINSGCLSACGPPPPPLVADFDWSPKPGCQNQPISFTDLSTGNITGWSWAFPGGVPSSSNQQNPTVTWNTPGTKSVTLTVSGQGSPNTITQSVDITALPVANFTFSVNGLIVTFTNTSTSATSYEWDFGDGGGSTDANPVYEYAQAGTYVVVLKAINSCGQSTKSFIVNTAPTALFEANPTNGCTPLVVTMVNQSSSNAVSYVWSFPGGAPSASNQANPTVVYAIAGTYSITLKATNGSGSNTYTRTDYITVKTTPSANFNFTVNGPTATFTNTTIGSVTSYLWDFGDGNTSTQVNPVHTYAAPGNYIVVLTATNECGSTTKSKPVEIITSSAPTASFTANPTSGCVPYNPVPAYDHIVVVVGGKANSDAVFGNSDAPYINSLANNGAKFSNSYAVFNPSQPNYLALYSGSNQGITNDNLITTAFTTANLGRELINAQKSYFTYSEGLPSVGFNGPVSGNYARIHNPAANWMGVGTNQIPATTNQPFTAFPVNFDSLPNVAFVVPDQCSGGHDVCPPLNNSVKQFDNWIQNNLDAYKQWCVNHNSLLIVTYDENASSGNNKIATVFYGAHVANGDYGQTINHYNVLRTIEEASRLSGHAGAAADAIPINNCWTPAATPLTVNFSNNSTGASSYLWHFPGGSPDSSLLANPTVQYSSPGTYVATLIANNANGRDTFSTTITVNTVPTPGFTYAVSKDTSFSFTNHSVGATTYLWTFGDGATSTLQNPVHNYAAHDSIYNYMVILQATNDCGTVSDTQMVRVVTHPKANFTATSASGCAPFTVQFNNSSTPNSISFLWQFSGGTPNSSTLQNPVVVYSTAGTYSATLIAINSSGRDTFSRTNYIVVNTTPTAGFTSAANGLSATFTNTSSGATSYAWNFGDGGISTGISPTHIYAADGTYTVILSATNACGTTTKTLSVTVATTPTAGFTASVTSGCAPLTVQFTNTSSANATAYDWQFPGGTPNASIVKNPVVVYSTPGTYSVTLIAINASGRDTITLTNYIVVNTTPTAGFTSATNGLTVNFTNTTTGASSYAWNFGDGGISTGINPTHIYAADGTYTVTLSATNACGTTTTTQSVTVASTPTAGFTVSETSGCAPLTVQFTNTSSSNASSFDWQFPGGNPSSSTAQNPPSAEYALPGTYTVTLTVSNAAGSSTSTQTIVVNGGPTANFTSTVSVLTATFTNASSNSLSYNWDFGDGNSSSNPNPTHNYAADGTYTVVLTASNNCGTSTFTQNVVINTAPGAGFSANTTSGCAVLSVNFNDISSGNPVSWAWDFPGGTPSSSTDQNPTVQYFTPGVYDVTLVVTSAGGSTSSFTQPGIITVNGAPSAGFISSVNGVTANFTNTSVNATSYVWNFGDGSNSTATDPTHTYSSDGVYTVTLVATNNCGSTIFEQTVTVVTPPTASFTTSASAGCTPFTVQFSNTSSSNATSYSWVFPGGNPPNSTQENPSATWNAAGVYVVTLTASNGAGSSTSTTTITVGTAPTAGFTYQIGGLTAVFNNISVNGNSYSWDFGDGSAPSSEANPNHTYGQVGDYPVTLSVTNDCGTVSFSQTVVVQGSPPVANISSNNTTGCLPFSVQFTDESAGAPTSWSWTFQGGTPSSSSNQNPLVSYSAPGTYDVVLVVTNIFGTATQSFPAYITVQAAPTAGFTSVANQTTVFFTSTSQNATSFSWNFGDGNTSVEENPIHTYSAPGTYTVSLAATNNCGTGIFQQTIVITSGTGEAAWIQGFRLFPNPNPGIFNIEMNGLPQDEVEFVLFNALGQQIKRETADFGSGSMLRSFDYGDLAAGVYTLRVQADGQAMFVKVAVGR